MTAVLEEDAALRAAGFNPMPASTFSGHRAGQRRRGQR